MGCRGDGRAVVVRRLRPPPQPLGQAGGPLAGGRMACVGGQRLLAERVGRGQVAGGLAVGRCLDQLVYALHRGPPIARSCPPASESAPGGSRNLNTFSTIPACALRSSGGGHASRIRFNCFNRAQKACAASQLCQEDTAVVTRITPIPPFSPIISGMEICGAFRRRHGEQRGDHGPGSVLDARRDRGFEGKPGALAARGR